jgi:trehalose 6-phosphate phosphatase
MPFNLDPNSDALFLDIDGTLLDIAPEPQSVSVPPALVRYLEQLHKKLEGALALVSGRSIQNIDRLFAPLRLPAAGVHGLEWRETGEAAMSASAPLDQKLKDKIEAAFKEYPGIFIENKNYSIAVHYRQAPEQERSIKATLLGIIDTATAGADLIEGRKVYEVIKQGYGKESAIQRFMQTPVFIKRRPVFLGDDETDKAAIALCSRYGGTGILVGRNKSAREGLFPGPEAVRAWLAQQAA